jgi:hypothetical protein
LALRRVVAGFTCMAGHTGIAPCPAGVTSVLVALSLAGAALGGTGVAGLLPALRLDAGILLALCLTGLAGCSTSSSAGRRTGGLIAVRLARLACRACPAFGPARASTSNASIARAGIAAGSTSAVRARKSGYYRYRT